MVGFFEKPCGYLCIFLECAAGALVGVFLLADIAEVVLVVLVAFLLQPVEVVAVLDVILVVVAIVLPTELGLKGVEGSEGVVKELTGPRSLNIILVIDLDVLGATGDDKSESIGVLAVKGGGDVIDVDDVAVGAKSAGHGHGCVRCVQ